MAVPAGLHAHDPAYRHRRDAVEHYFDRTAAQAWAALTSHTPVSWIRRTVREGRDRMRATLLSWLPRDLAGVTLHDAGCGPGTLAIEAAHRGAQVTGTDLSASLVGVAAERAAEVGMADRVTFGVGDMRGAAGARYDYVVAMDSLIHYPPAVAVAVLADLAATATRGVVFTLVPGSATLRTMRKIGRLFPRSDRSPAVEPVEEAEVRRLVAAHPALAGWQLGRSARIRRGFYVSQAYELVPR